MTQEQRMEMVDMVMGELQQFGTMTETQQRLNEFMMHRCSARMLLVIADIAISRRDDKVHPGPRDGPPE